MLMAGLFISAPNWLGPAILLFILGAIASLIGYLKTSISSTLKSVLLFFRLLGLAMLAFCLLEPMWTSTRPKTGANYFAMIADNSQSLQITDVGQARNRGEILKALLVGDSRWQATLGEIFQLRKYFFDSKLQSTRDFGELKFDGRASNLGEAFKTLRERFKGQPVAGVLLFTDGNATDPEANLDLTGLPPIYPVLSGMDEGLADVSVRNVSVSQTAFEDAPVTIQADIGSTGLAGRQVAARLVQMAVRSRDSTNAIGAEKIIQTQTAGSDASGNAVFRFEVKPESRGIVFYRVETSIAGEGSTNATAEATLVNNQRVVAVDRTGGPYRILFVGGRPSWEYKFLNRALAEDDQVQLVAIIRIAKREPKFSFRGRTGETSNPLYRGFNKGDEETERYDQPVLVRLNTRDQFELKGGFPKTAEELFSYNAVILEDVEAEFFTRDQLSLLQKFVSQRGGGFLMLGGPDSFHEGKYDRTPVGEMLPVYLDRVPQVEGPFQWSLSREGMLEPWVRLRRTEEEERERLKAMPGFQVMNATREAKPGATVIAQVRDAAGRNYPALVAQRFGRGRSAVLTIADLWRWGFQDADLHKDMDKAWRQIMRWLVSDVPGFVEVRSESLPGDESIQVKVEARDKKFEPVENGTVNLKITPMGVGLDQTNQARTVHLQAEPSESEPGEYTASFLPRQSGGYKVEAQVKDGSGNVIGSSETGWSSDDSADEFRSLTPNKALAEKIAKRTGGEVVTARQLDKLVASLGTRKAPVVESWSFPVWHRAGVLLGALFLFAAEWGVRRWKGLP